MEFVVPAGLINSVKETKKLKALALKMQLEAPSTSRLLSSTEKKAAGSTVEQWWD